MTELGEEVLDYFYGITERSRNSRLRWVLSEATIRKIAKAAEIEIDDDEPIPEHNTLCGCPIRIDDSVSGLSHEFI